MKKLFLGFVLGVFLLLPLSAQERPTLTIMPLSGESSGGEEALMVLLARDSDIRSAFTLVVSGGNFNNVVAGVSATDDSDAIKARFNADYAILVRTERVGNGSLAFISIVNTGSLQLLAGDYRKYIEIRELRAVLPDITKKFVKASQSAVSLPRLAFLPFYTGVNGLKADTMKLAIGIEIANRQKYAVLPWTLAVDGLNLSLPNPYSGIVDLDSIKAINSAANIPYVVKGDVLSLGTVNLFLASVLKTQDASFLSEGEAEFRVISEDLEIIPVIATALLSTPAGILSSNPAENFVRIEGAGFLMGSPASEVARDSDENQYQAIVGTFSVSKFEVTQAEYEAVMGSNPSKFKRPDFPVEQVSWFDAVNYCNARSVREGFAPAYTISQREITWNHDADGYRLPTEAEWEYACRAGSTAAFSFGNAISTDQANFDGKYPYNNAAKGVYRAKTTPAGSFQPNAWGIYDMEGNVYEWCWDQYKGYSGVDLDGTLSQDGVIRGGSWDSEGRFLRAANRAHAAHSAKQAYIGFRVVRTVR
jgi:formylglycine-generating enzyme required for sulfatase activity